MQANHQRKPSALTVCCPKAHRKTFQAIDGYGGYCGKERKSFIRAMLDLTDERMRRIASGTY